jgi:hypothetical protein
MAQKLGLKDGSSVVLIDAPARWSIAGAPTGIRLRRALAKDFDVAVWFVRSLNNLRRGVGKMATATPAASSLWVAWPRKAGGHESDMSEQAIRDAVLPLGLVDVKVAALDQDWSGVKVVWRLSRRASLAAPPP